MRLQAAEPGTACDESTDRATVPLVDDTTLVPLRRARSRRARTDLDGPVVDREVIQRTTAAGAGLLTCG